MCVTVSVFPELEAALGLKSSTTVNTENECRKVRVTLQHQNTFSLLSKNAYYPLFACKVQIHNTQLCVFPQKVQRISTFLIFVHTFSVQDSLSSCRPMRTDTGITAV